MEINKWVKVLAIVVALATVGLLLAVLFLLAKDDYDNKVYAQDIMPISRGYMYNGGSALDIRDVTYTLNMIDTVIYNDNGEMDFTTISGTINNDEANKLVDTSKDFEALGVEVGWGVYNYTDKTHGFVCNIDDASDGKLGIGTYACGALDIYDNGESYKVYAGGRFTASMDGKYYVNASILCQTNVAGEYGTITVVKNGFNLSNFEFQNKVVASGAFNMFVNVAGVVEMDTGDWVAVSWYNNVSTATKQIWYGDNYNSLTVYKISEGIEIEGADMEALSDNLLLFILCGVAVATMLIGLKYTVVLFVATLAWAGVAFTTTNDYLFGVSILMAVVAIVVVLRRL